MGIVAGATMAVANWRERIEVNPDVLVGKPIVKGTRLAVAFVVELLANGWSEADILDNYPHLSREDIQACLAYASAMLNTEKIYPIAI